MKGNLLTTIKNSLIYIAGGFLVRLSVLILLPLLTDAQYLTVKEFGIYTLVDITSNFAVNVMGLGLYMGFTRFYWDDNFKVSRKYMFFNTLVIVVLFALIIFALSWVLAPVLSRWLFQTPAYTFIFQLGFISALLTALAQLPKTLMKLKSNATLHAITSVVRAVCVVLFVWYFLVHKSMGLQGVFIGMVLSSVAALLSMVLFSVRNISVSIDKRYIKALISYTFPLFLSGVIAAILGLLDRFVLNANSSLENVAVYSIGFKLSNTIKVLVIMSIQMALSPLMMKKMNDPGHQEFYPQVLRLFSIGLMFVIIALILFSKEVIMLFTNEPVYLDAIVVVSILSFGFYFEMLKDTVVVGLTIEKKTMTIGFISLITTGLSLVLYQYFVGFWDMKGAAFAFLITQIIYFVLMLVFAQKSHFIPYRFASVFAVLFIGAALVIASQVLIFENEIADFMVRIAILSLYPILILFTGIFKRRELKHLIHEIKAKQSKDV